VADYLNQEERMLFYDLWYGLLEYAGHVKITKDVKPEELKRLAEKVYLNPFLIDDYISVSDLDKREIKILESWKHTVRGTFFLYKNLKEGAVVIENHSHEVYVCKGLSKPLNEAFLYMEPPVMFKGTLLPFEKTIVTDGLNAYMPYLLGSEIKEKLKYFYRIAGNENRIHRDLKNF